MRLRLLMFVLAACVIVATVLSPAAGATGLHPTGAASVVADQRGGCGACYNAIDYYYFDDGYVMANECDPDSCCYFVMNVGYDGHGDYSDGCGGYQEW